ncbi:MAG: hypothetical protein QF886_26105, partial [Planctomycetota bacterium]|nr:hypothetical protein [Planctomycetota bacterium]
MTANRGFAEPGAAAGAEPWFTNVASKAGVQPFDGAWNKFTDINGDGWPDVLLLGGGGDWMKEFLKRSGFPDGLPPAKEGELKIPLADWKGEKAGFEMFDFNGDGVLTRHELSVARPSNRLRAFASDSANGGGRKFVEVTESSGVRRNSKGNGRGRLTRLIVAADIDDDGDVDLLVVNIEGETDSFYSNEGTFFSDATASLGLGTTSRRYTRFGV